MTLLNGRHQGDLCSLQFYVPISYISVIWQNSINPIAMTFFPVVTEERFMVIVSSHYVVENEHLFGHVLPTAYTELVVYIYYSF